MYHVPLISNPSRVQKDEGGGCRNLFSEKKSGLSLAKLMLNSRLDASVALNFSLVIGMVIILLDR